MIGKRFAAAAAVSLSVAAISPTLAHADETPAGPTITVTSATDPSVALSVTLDPDAESGVIPESDVAAIGAALDAQALPAPDALTPEMPSTLEADVVSLDENAPEEPVADGSGRPGKGSLTFAGGLVPLRG